jgi:probable selenium-dependent hydroxylase accessory protein YqeC
VPTTVHETLAGSLGLGRRELVALVGGGGKTSALQRLARELVAKGARVVVGTTTAMFLNELEEVGTVVLSADGGDVEARLEAALAEGGPGAAVAAPGEGGKVAGLPPADFDGLWAQATIDYLLIEADGSRGRPLKAFGSHEPQIPAGVTTVVQVAGLSALGQPLTESVVHRAGILCEALGVPFGVEVSPVVFAAALRTQLRRLRAVTSSRIITLLNQAEARGSREAGLAVAADMLKDGDLASAARPDALVVASLQDAIFVEVAAPGRS